METFKEEKMTDNKSDLFKIPSCLFDNDINTIATYEFIPYEKKHGTAGLMMRIAEIYASASLVYTINKFNKATGYHFQLPRVDCIEREIIIAAINELVDDINGKVRDIDVRRDGLSSYIKRVNEGNTKFTGDSIRNEIAAVQQSLGSLAQRRESAVNLLDILTKVNQLVTYYFSGGDVEFNELTTIRKVPSLHELRAFRECENALNDLLRLENALNAIISRCNCSIPQRRFQKSTDEKELAQNSAAMFYYSPEGESLRNIMDFTKYLGLRNASHEAKKNKAQKMRADISSMLALK